MGPEKQRPGRRGRLEVPQGPGVSAQRVQGVTGCAGPGSWRLSAAAQPEPQGPHGSLLLQQEPHQATRPQSTKHLQPERLPRFPSSPGIVSSFQPQGCSVGAESPLWSEAPSARPQALPQPLADPGTGRGVGKVKVKLCPRSGSWSLQPPLWQHFCDCCVRLKDGETVDSGDSSGWPRADQLVRAGQGSDPSL